jgi:hypothetical protein
MSLISRRGSMPNGRSDCLSFSTARCISWRVVSHLSHVLPSELTSLCQRIGSGSTPEYASPNSPPLRKRTRGVPGSGARGPIVPRRAGPRAEEHVEDCSSPELSLRGASSADVRRPRLKGEGCSRRWGARRCPARLRRVLSLKEAR